MSADEFNQKTPTGKTYFKFNKDLVEFSFSKKGMQATEEIYYSEIKQGLSKFRERKQSWLTVLVCIFFLYGFAAIIIKDQNPEFFVPFNIIMLIATPIVVLYSFKNSIEDFWSLSTYQGKRILILDTSDREKIYDLFKEKIKINAFLHENSISLNKLTEHDEDQEKTVQ